MKNSFIPATVVAVSLLAGGFGSAAFAGAIEGILAPESWTSCTALLCIDAPPPDGSSGWGWDSKANAPVTFLAVGKIATFSVTMLQDGSTTPLCGVGPGTGSITLTYSTKDFSLSTTSGALVVSTNPFDRGGVATFSYSGDFFCDGDQSDSFFFTPLNPTIQALVTATIIVDGSGQQASGTFPVAIIGAPHRH